MTAAEAQEAVVAALRERGAAARRGALHPLGAVLAPLRRADRAADLAAVVLPHGRAGGAGDRGRSSATRCGSSPTQCKRVYLDWMREDPALVHLAPALVGAPAPGLVLRRRERDLSSPSEPPERCGACGGELRQEEDVLDTWFSSALWPFATLGWPDDDARAARPSTRPSFLTTARDIIFLWVARMIMTGLEFTGEVPFRDVYVHSVIQAPRRAADVEEPRHRDRPARRDRRARRRRAALRPAGDVLDPGRALLRRRGSSRAATSPTSSGTPRG